MMHTITLYKTEQGWMALDSDPEVRRLFGADYIPTAFTAQASSRKVFDEIRRLNPEKMIQFGFGFCQACEEKTPHTIAQCGQRIGTNRIL